jgi:hypothetical protein
MSGLNAGPDTSGPTPPAVPSAPAPGRVPAALAGLLRDAGVVLVWFAVAGVVGGLVWWQVTPLAEFTRSATTGQMGEDQLGRQVAADGWYFVIAAAGGLLSGVALTALRRRDPLVTVILVVLGALLAAVVMSWVGLWAGPGDPDKALLHAAVGDKVPMQLKTHATGVHFVWLITALLGAVGVLWGIDDRGSRTTPDG